MFQGETKKKMYFKNLSIKHLVGLPAEKAAPGEVGKWYHAEWHDYMDVARGFERWKMEQRVQRLQRVQLDSYLRFQVEMEKGDSKRGI